MDRLSVCLIALALVLAGLIARIAWVRSHRPPPVKITDVGTLNRALTPEEVATWQAAPFGKAIIFKRERLIPGAPDIQSAVFKLKSELRTVLSISFSNDHEPTIPAQCVIYIDPTPELLKRDEGHLIRFDGKDFRYGGWLVGQTGKNFFSYFSVALPVGIRSLSLRCGSNTADGVLIDADFEQKP